MKGKKEEGRKDTAEEPQPIGNYKLRTIIPKMRFPNPYRKSRKFNEWGRMGRRGKDWRRV